MLAGAAKSELSDALKEQHLLDPSIQQLEGQLAGLLNKGSELEAAVERTTQHFASYPDKMREMSQLKLAASAAEGVYKSLGEQRFQIGVAEAMSVSDLQLIESATIPPRHVSPKLLVNLLLGLVLGSMVGIGLAALFEYTDDSLNRPEDIVDSWSIARLGVVPRFSTESGRLVLDELSPTHPISEAYRTVRNSMVFASVDKPLKLIGVSSSVPEEGKSTFVVNLALSMGREGKSVLVVDCDLRRPSQHRHFSSVSNHHGLCDVLAGNSNLGDVIQKSGHQGVSVLASGPTPSDPARLVESLRMRQVLLDLSRQFDVVVVDTPPALLVNDAVVVAQAVDGMILLVESGKTSRKLVADMLARFRGAGIEPLGLVLNKLDLFSAGYGRYAKAYKAYESDVVAPSREEKVG